MLIYNPTDKAVVAQHDGASYVFKPEERKEIFNSYAAKHILNRWGKYGLVDITYSPQIAKQYVEHEFYVHEKRKEGLLLLLVTMQEQLQSYRTYDDECGDKKTVERLRFARQADEIEKRIAAVQKIVEDTETMDMSVHLHKKAEALRAQAAALTEQAKVIDGGNTGKSTRQREDRIA